MLISVKIENKQLYITKRSGWVLSKEPPEDIHISEFGPLMFQNDFPQSDTYRELVREGHLKPTSRITIL